MKTTVWFEGIVADVVFILLLTAPAFSQSALDGFDPSVTGSDVRAAAVQPDGKIVFGGLFTGVRGITRSNLARVHFDGSLDTLFDPAPNNAIRCVVALPDGRILVGGDFTTIGGMMRSHLARFNSDGSLDMAFDPGPNATVHGIAPQPDGRIVIGGSFSSVAGEVRAAIARLNSDGSVDTRFNPGADGTVQSVAIQADGRVMVGGSFSTLGGVIRRAIGRLNADGTVDTAFDPVTGGFVPEVGGTVFSLLSQADGKIVVGGNFVTVDAASRTNLARLNADGTVDVMFNHWVRGTVTCLTLQPDGAIVAGGVFHAVTSVLSQTFTNLVRFRPGGAVDAGFKPRPNFGVFGMALQPDGNLVIGGTFNTLIPAGGAGAGRQRLARLYSDGRLDRTLNPGSSGTVYTHAIQPDGKILVGGFFTNLAGHMRLARLNPDGSLDNSFNASADSAAVFSLAVQADGKIIVGGSFTNLVGQPRRGVGRLNIDGTLDASFNPVANGPVYNLAIQADGKIVLGGLFTVVGGQLRNSIARLNADGTLDSAFNPGANELVFSLAVQPDGKILVGGRFTGLGGQPRNYLGRLHADGSLDISFNPEANDFVRALIVQPDRKILVGGRFASLHGQPRRLIGRLNLDGSLDTAFNPGPSGGALVLNLGLQADGKILVGGEFTMLSGQARTNIGRLNADGTLDTAFAPGTDFQGPNPFPNYVSSLTLQTDGKILVGGTFYVLGGQAQPYIGRLTGGVALQSLAIQDDSTAITWSRDGHVPEVEQVTFEQSFNGTNYVVLGSATRVPGGWKRKGLSFPTGQSFYIRGRGRITCGYNNGSRGLVETVALFWQLPPPFISSVQVIGEGVFQFSLTNTNAVAFSVLATTNAAAPLASWENLGAPVSIGSEVYQFIDPNATNHARRFYQLRSP